MSTIFVEFDIEKSDIDIVCEYQYRRHFTSTFEAVFKGYDEYCLRQYSECTVGSFTVGGFVFEVYASQIPVVLQPAFRHYQVMQRLAFLGGSPIKQKVRALKKTGIKTEPAISQVLGLDGNPYDAVLELESWSDEQLKVHIQSCI